MDKSIDKSTREIIEIDESLCDGCAACIPGCPEGALQIIDGKARLVSDLFCDGLGACVGECPKGAIKVVERQAQAYDERKVMENIAAKGENTIKAHLKHLNEHNEEAYIAQAIDYLKENGIPVPDYKDASAHQCHGGGCPGSAEENFSPAEKEELPDADDFSMLSQWPIQLHLLNPQASFLKGADLLLAADCAAFSSARFHGKYLKGKSLAIACPKLDSGIESYVDKLITMIDEAKLNTISIIRMHVPCCGGLTRIAQTALQRATRKVPVKEIMIDAQANVLKEEWI